MNKPLPTLVAKGLTGIQLGLITALFILGPAIVTHSSAMVAVQVIGLAIGVYGIYSIGIFNFSAYPIPRKGSILVCNGPYKYIRHPMYLAVFFYCIPIAIFQPTAYKIAIVIVLLFIILIKIEVEEQLLEERFSGYQAYKKKSWRIIPFLY